MSSTTEAKAKSATTNGNARSAKASAKKAPRLQRVTKKQELIRLLGKKAGADIATLSETFGWQRHTTRAALTGLRKAGFEIVRIDGTDGKPARYRIEGSPPRPAPVAQQAEVTTDAG